MLYKDGLYTISLLGDLSGITIYAQNRPSVKAHLWSIVHSFAQGSIACLLAVLSYNLMGMLLIVYTANSGRNEGLLNFV
jgi:hypothetical protein